MPVHGLAVDPLNPNQVFVAGTGGIFGLYGDAPAQPYPAGTAGVTAVAVDPGDPSGNTYYVSGANGGVWKTTNGGASWTPLTNGTDGPGALSQVTVSKVDPLDMYGVGQGGVLSSTDGGRTWSLMGGQTPPRPLDVAASPTDPDTLYIAGAGGLWRTVDGGASWQPIYPNPGGASLVETGPGGTVFAVIDGTGLVKGVEPGVSWTPINEGLGGGRVTNLAVDPSNPQKLYVSDQAGKVFMTGDGGATWTPLVGSSSPGM
jgi:photosystem II stability/assembly factor-like uncharacterized protein